MADTWKSIKKEIFTQFYSVNDTWLRDCVDYYRSEHTDATQAEILAFVISQWQLSDLREINNENGCLPKNLAQQKLVTLPGTYILQIEKGYDISTSKYKQLEKIRNISNENAQVNESDKNPSWEPKSKRMMNLYLTDGIQDVIAIEYQPIKFLKDLILPGFKIMINGPVTCRKGVLLLHDKNCCEIGGEVEGLLIKNATENVLARALNLVENPDPYKDNPEADKDNKDEIKFDDFMDVDFAELDQIDNLTKNKHVNNSNISMTSTNKKRDSIMLNSLPVCFESIPAEKNEMDADELKRSIDAYNLDIIGHEETDNQLNNKNLINNAEEMDDFNFDPDFLHDLELEDLEIVSVMKEKSNYPDKTNDSEVFQKKPPSNTSSNVNKFSKAKNIPVFNVVKKVTETVVKPALIFSDSDFPDDFDLKDVDIAAMIERPDHPDKTNVNKFSKEKNIPAFNVTKKVTETTVKPAPIFSHSDMKALSAPTPIAGPSNKKLSNPSTSPAKYSKSTRKPDSKFDAKNNQKITAFITKTDTPEKRSSLSSPKKYDSVQDVLKLMPVDKLITKTVKGTVKSMKKLEKREQNWHLEAIVSDDNGSIDIFFSSQVLEKIVGLSVVEFSKRKKLIKKDPGVELELRTALRKAEATISKLNGLLQLELLPNESKAKIVSIP